MNETNYELAPRPGTPTSQRKAELDQARFVAVRNLAYMIYKRPDGHPLMTYQETLDDRERVKQVVIAHELALGLLVNDGQPGAAPAAAAPMAPAPAMPRPAGAPPNGAPVGMMAAPAPVGVVPMTPLTPAPAAPQVAPPATPQQAAAAGAPQEQPAPAAPAGAPTGRRRRSTAPPQGDPQTAGPVPAPAAPAMTPAPGYGAPAPTPYPTGGVPAAAPAYPATAATPAAAGLSTPTAVGDLSPIVARLDSIGHGLSDVSKDVDGLKAQNAALKQLLYEVLATVQHIYGQFQPLGKLVFDAKVETIEDFRRFIKTYTGNPS